MSALGIGCLFSDWAQSIFQDLIHSCPLWNNNFLTSSSTCCILSIDYDFLSAHQEQQQVGCWGVDCTVVSQDTGCGWYSMESIERSFAKRSGFLPLSLPDALLCKSNCSLCFYFPSVEVASPCARGGCKRVRSQTGSPILLGLIPFHFQMNWEIRRFRSFFATACIVTKYQLFPVVDRRKQPTAHMIPKLCRRSAIPSSGSRREYERERARAFQIKILGEILYNVLGPI